MKKKLLFGITSLTLGGAERVLVDLVNALCDKYDITIFTIYAKGELEKQLSRKVKLKSLYNVSYSELSSFEKHFSMPLKVLLLKKYIYNKKIKEDYDTEIAFLEGPITRLFSSKNTTTKKIAWVHNDVSLVFGNGIKAKLKKNIDKKVYSKYETLIFVSRDNLEKFEKIYSDLKLINKKVIYNYIDKESILKKAEGEQEISFAKNTINFVTVARLVSQKGIDRLVNVHSKLIKEGLNNNFYVIGDGPEKEKIQEMIKENKVEATFHLLGKKENPYPYIQAADALICSSRAEGFSTVATEALILNKPIFTTDCSGMRELFGEYQCGIICDNSEDGIYDMLHNVLEQADFSPYIDHCKIRAKDFTIRKRMSEVEGILNA